jgi:hypothetical protein
VDPFLRIADFTIQYGSPLTAAETAVATRLLLVASERIVELNPDADPTKAAQVVFEIVRDATRYGDFEALSEFENDTSRRKERGIFDSDRRTVEDYLTKRHKRLLDIPLRAMPSYQFPASRPCLTSFDHFAND